MKIKHLVPSVFLLTSDVLLSAFIQPSQSEEMPEKIALIGGPISHGLGEHDFNQGYV